jgi:hypothetical protein
MQTNRRAFLAGAVALAVSGRSLWAADKKSGDRKEEGEWEKLGEREAGRKEERDVLEVTSRNRYSALTFKVDEGDVAIEDVKVTFDDDQTFSPDTKLRFREGERSGKIDLPGKSRAIKRIRFLYRSTGGKRAVIHVYGKVADAAGKK